MPIHRQKETRSYTGKVTNYICECCGLETRLHLCGRRLHDLLIPYIRHEFMLYIRIAINLNVLTIVEIKMFKQNLIQLIIAMASHTNV